ncbi:hypothetical protein, partial [Cellulomonas bogoriensis]|uniref:hypothetical protein n=1 Tax=Cellulomonas bogoriensis TaxID=301388 RepID=UPI000552DC8F
MVDRGRLVAGWYPDPTGRARMRHWSDGWTAWVSDGQRVWDDAVASERRRVGPEDASHLVFAREVILPEVQRTMGTVVAAQLTGVLGELE